MNLNSTEHDYRIFNYSDILYISYNEMWRPSWRSSSSSLMSLRASVVSHVPAISPAWAANLHGLSFTLNHELNFCCLWVSFMHQGPLPEATQLTTVLIKFVRPLSGLPLSVEAQTSSTRGLHSGSPTLHSDSSPPLAFTCFTTSIFVKYLNALI